MESQKNNKGIIVLLIIIIVILFALCILFATGIINFRTIKNNNLNLSDNKIYTNNNDISTNSNLKKHSLLDLSKLEKYKNYDGSYGAKEIYIPRNSDSNEFYNIKLLLDGKVVVCNNESCNNISNTNDVIDIKEMVIAGRVEMWKYYILQDNGDVYRYELGNCNNGIYTATKLTNISNVIELVSFSYNNQKNAGGLWGIFAITQDNQYIEIDREGV